MEVRISANKYFYPGLPSCPDRLPCTLVVPAIYKHSLIVALANNPGNLRCIETGKAAMSRRVGNVLQKGVWISRQKIYVPFEFDPEPRLGLFLRCCLVTKIHVNPEIRMRRHPAEPRSMVLDRMSAYDGEAIWCAHRQRKDFLQ